MNSLRNRKFIREYQNLTQKELAETVGCSKNHISALERGVKYPRAAMIEKPADELGVLPFVLFMNCV
jgi:transcriptional regulator with XRE-family HTH domain